MCPSFSLVKSSAKNSSLPLPFTLHLKTPTQERAWYDKHREDILRGGLGERMEEEGINLFQYFSSTAYSGGYTRVGVFL